MPLSPQDRQAAYQNARARRVLAIVQKLAFVDRFPERYPRGTKKRLNAEKRRLIGLIKRSAFSHPPA
jgi:hypothetical protein